MDCQYCPNFKCKLLGDFNRHIKTDGHVKNKEIKEKEKENDFLFNYHIYYVMWSKKMKKVNKQFINKAILPRHVYEMKETLKIIQKINK
jgi:hypothetical protein